MDADTHQTDSPVKARKTQAFARCLSCSWSWKPGGGQTQEGCPNCGRQKDVRHRQFDAAKLIRLKNEYVKPVHSSTKSDRKNRKTALMIVGRGRIACVSCGCDKIELIEINHIHGGGQQEAKTMKSTEFHRAICKFKRPVDDLDLRCRPCNAVHALELKFGPLPFKVTWEMK